MVKFRRSKAVSYEAKRSSQSLSKWGFGVVDEDTRRLTNLERQYLEENFPSEESSYEKKVRGEIK